MIVHKDKRSRAHIHRAPDHFARVDGGLVNRTIADMVIVNQPVLAVEVKDAHPLNRQMCHVDGEIVD